LEVSFGYNELLKEEKERDMFQEFKKFALRGNVLDMAVGIIIGSAFSTIVNSLVNDIIMPPAGMLLGGMDFENLYLLIKAGESGGPYPSLADAQAAGAVTVNYGRFINSLVSFLIVAFVLFLLIRGMNRLQRKKKEETPEPTTKECPYCMTDIPKGAKRCPHCTSQLT